MQATQNTSAAEGWEPNVSYCRDKRLKVHAGNRPSHESLWTLALFVVQPSILAYFPLNKSFWKELYLLLSLHYVTILYQLNCLTTIKYIAWFPLLCHHCYCG
jgi:hypothetical protein